jgi:hypothetical protein
MIGAEHRSCGRKRLVSGKTCRPAREGTGVHEGIGSVRETGLMSRRDDASPTRLPGTPAGPHEDLAP